MSMSKYGKICYSRWKIATKERKMGLVLTAGNHSGYVFSDWDAVYISLMIPPVRACSATWIWQESDVILWSSCDMMWPFVMFMLSNTLLSPFPLDIAIERAIKRVINIDSPNVLVLFPYFWWIQSEQYLYENRWRKWWQRKWTAVLIVGCNHGKVVDGL